MRRYKSKIQRWEHESLRKGEGGVQPGLRPDPAGVDDAEEDELPRVVRTKRFAIKPMDIDEAIMQMELLGHDFFVFANAGTDEVNVLYQRKDGQYGLIEPTMED